MIPLRKAVKDGEGNIYVNMELLPEVSGVGKKTIDRIEEQIIKRKKKTIEEVGFSNKKYDVIYADPPWEDKDSGSGSRVVSSKYPTMNVLELLDLPIDDISKDNCLLFCWVTFPRLLEGIQIIKGWGFDYKGLAFNWVKKNIKTDSWFWGMGHYTRQNPEVCLIGRKGKFDSKSSSVHSVIDLPIERHSKKPDIIRTKIEEITGKDTKKIELFAREFVDGWDCWGNEVDTIDYN